MCSDAPKGQFVGKYFSCKHEMYTQCLKEWSRSGYLLVMEEEMHFQEHPLDDGHKMVKVIIDNIVKGMKV